MGYKMRPLYLRKTAPVVLATRLLLCRIKECGWLNLTKKEDKIYRDAEIKFLVDNPRYCELFIYGGDLSFIRYRNHKRDKNGKLVSVEAYAEERI